LVISAISGWRCGPGAHLGREAPWVLRGKERGNKQGRCVCGAWMDVITCCELAEDCGNSCDSA